MVADPSRFDRANPALSGFHWLVGGVVTVTAAMVATLLALVFAATVALGAVIVGGALAAWAVAFRVRKATRLRPASTRTMVIEARKVGHSWVAYGWDQTAR